LDSWNSLALTTPPLARSPFPPVFPLAGSKEFISINWLLPPENGEFLLLPLDGDDTRDDLNAETYNKKKEFRRAESTGYQMYTPLQYNITLLFLTHCNLTVWKGHALDHDYHDCS